MSVLIEFEVSGFVKMTLLKKKKKNTYVVDICEEYIHLKYLSIWLDRNLLGIYFQTCTQSFQNILIRCAWGFSFGRFDYNGVA